MGHEWISRWRARRQRHGRGWFDDIEKIPGEAQMLVRVTTSEGRRVSYRVPTERSDVEPVPVVIDFTGKVQPTLGGFEAQLHRVAKG